MAIDGDAARLPSMSRVEHYRDKLRTLDDWDPFLLAESRLPGPTANLELAVADKGTPEQLGPGLPGTQKARRWARPMSSSRSVAYSAGSLEAAGNARGAAEQGSRVLLERSSGGCPGPRPEDDGGVDHAFPGASAQPGRPTTRLAQVDPAWVSAWRARLG